MNIMRKVAGIGSLTMLSRIFGFVRDVLMAKYLGAGMAADAFFIAFKLPNFFRRLFAEGAFSAGFVPLFAKKLGKEITAESQAQAEAFAGQVLAVFLPILLIFLILMESAMVPIMLGLTGGFDGDTVKFNLAVKLGHIIFPYLTMISLVAFLAGILNAFEKYSAAAFVPVLLNICMITALIEFGETPAEKAQYLAASVSISGVLQFLWLYGTAVRCGIKIRLPRPTLNQDIKELFRIIGPAAMGAGIIQLNLLIDVFLAARFLPEGSVSWLFYADRLNQLTVGIVGVAIGTVLLPSIARVLSAGDTIEATRQQNAGVRFGMLLTFPATAALLVAAPALIATLFERDAFTSVDTASTAAALVAYAAGLPAYVLQKVLTPGYFARGDTKTPMKIAAVSLVVNTVLNLLLIAPFAHVGLALATAVAAWLNVLLLYIGLVRRGHFSLHRETFIFIIKCLVACAVMTGFILYFLTHIAGGAFTTSPEQTRILWLALMIAASITVYFTSLFLLRGLRMHDIRRLIRP